MDVSPEPRRHRGAVPVGLALALLTAAVGRAGGAPFALDLAVQQHLAVLTAAGAAHALQGPVEVVTRLGQPTADIPVTAALAALLGRAHRRRAGGFLASVAAPLIAVSVAVPALKALLGRPGPPGTSVGRLLALGYFPSGHTATALVCSAVLARVAVASRPRLAGRLRVAGGAWTTLMAAAMVYDGYHWLSDVVGGALLAGLVLLLLPAGGGLPGRPDVRESVALPDPVATVEPVPASLRPPSGSTRRLLTALTAVLLVLTGTAPAYAGSSPHPHITGGSSDNGSHPYVAMLLPPGENTPSCTGVLVATDNGGLAVLTAAHCLASSGPRSGTGWQVVFGDVYSDALPRYSGTYVVSGQFDSSVSFAHDLAAIVLSTRPPIAPAHLAEVGRADSRPTSSVTVVGTGQPATGQRRVASEVITGRDATWLYLRPGSGNSCTGDSGGPDLVPDTDIVLALTDQGTCSADQDLRVDTDEAHRFLVDATRAAGAPDVSTQPADVTVPADSSATFTASAATTTSVSTQWQRSTDGGVSYADVAGATDPTYVVRAASGDLGNRYRAVFSNAAGVATTRAATLTVVAPAGRGVAGLYHPLLPTRVLDTRDERSPVAAGSDRELAVTGAAGVPSAGVSAVVVAVVVPRTAAAGDLEVYPVGSKPGTRTSNLNWPAGRTVANLVTVRVGTGGRIGLSVDSRSPVHVAVDVLGWYGDSSTTAGARYTALTPSRVLDTGGGSGAVPAGEDRALTLRGVGGVPDRPDVTGVAFNLTGLGAAGPADVQVYPGGSRPPVRTSNLNLARGQTAAVAVNATLGADGSVRLSVSSGRARLIVDVVGYYSGSGGRFVPLDPLRILERTAVVAGSDRVVPVAGRNGVPPTATGVLVNLTGVGATTSLDLQAYPTGNPPPQRTSVLNLRRGEAVPNLLPARLGAGSLSLSSSSGQLLVVLDQLGYFTAG